MQEEVITVTHSLFTINIFRSRQTFIALYLSLFDQPQFSVSELKEILHRTRSPPIAVSYTLDLLEPKSCQSYGLIIIRFLSQLADLSSGNSISIALQDNLSQGIFLSQIRHSLTHKYMVSDQLILKARKLILKDLRQKYWDSIYQQMITQNIFCPIKVKAQYQRIYNQVYPRDISNKIIDISNLVQMQNYEFHKHLPTLLSKQIQTEQFVQFYKLLTQYKKTITFSQLLTAFSKDYDNLYYFGLIHNVLENKLIKQDSLKEKMIMTKLRSMRFFNWIEYNSILLDLLPLKIKQIVQIPFEKAINQGFDFYKPQQ